MSLTKFSTLALTSLLIGTLAFAQDGQSHSESSAEDAALYTKSSHWAVNVSTVNWNDTLKVSQSAQQANETANYNALVLTAQREVNIQRWGYNIGLFLGAGQANGGGVVQSVGYKESKVNFTMAGISPRGYYRVSDKVSAGLTAMIFSRNINWPEPSGKSVDAGTNVNASLLADINLHLFEHWDFYQGLGTMNAGSTLWKLGIAYRF